jgi:hypothetical protein
MKDFDRVFLEITSLIGFERNPRKFGVLKQEPDVTGGKTKRKEALLHALNRESWREVGLWKCDFLYSERTVRGGQTLGNFATDARGERIILADFFLCFSCSDCFIDVGLNLSDWKQLPSNAAVHVLK